MQGYRQAVSKLACLRARLFALRNLSVALIFLPWAQVGAECCGEGGALQAKVAVCGELSPCSGQAACSFGGLSPGAARLFPPRRAARMARGLCAFSPGAACLFPLRRAARAARGLALSPPARCAPSLHGLSALLVGSQGVFRQEPGPVCRVGGGGFSGAEFAPCPSPCLLPPAGMGRLFSGVSQSL